MNFARRAAPKDHHTDGPARLAEAHADQRFEAAENGL
jgi:hypothetical protein